MDLKIQRIIFGILTLITFIAIFIFSGQNGEDSQNTSEGFTKKIIEILQIGKGLDGEEREQLIKNSQYIIRKLAHFTIYTFAGINIFGFINTFNIKTKNKMLFTLLIGIIYAISDEFHQMFSGGRTPAIRDVFIDSSGIIFGILIFVVVIRVINTKHKYNV